MKLKSKHGKSSIDNLENYKNQGTIIRSKEMIIINQEIPNKYFHQKEQQKEAKKTNETTECQKFYQTFHKKQKNCECTQNELLNNIPKLVQTGQNRQLTKPINKNELQQAINQWKMKSHQELVEFL